MSKSTLPCMQNQRALERGTDMRRLTMPLLLTASTGEPVQCLTVLTGLGMHAWHATETFREKL